MSAINSVTWFEIGTDDPASAKRFYGDLFGWTFSADGPYSNVTAPGAEHPIGGVFDTSVGAPGGVSNYAVFTVQVEDVAATVAKAEMLGAKVVAPPRTTADGAVTFAHLRDVSGSHFEIWAPGSAGA